MTARTESGRILGWLLLSCTLVVLLATPATADMDSRGHLRDEAVYMSAREAAGAERAWRAASGSSEQHIREYRHAPLCNVTSPTLVAAIDRSCAPSDSTVQVADCEGLAPVAP